MSSNIIAVFGSSQVTDKDEEFAQAYELGKLLAEAGCTVCNGGYGGIMEATARGAKDAGGKTIGITTEEFKGARCNRWIDEEKRMKTWKDRLFGLIELGDGYVVCGGGTGTLVELSCVWEMSRKGLMGSKPIVLLSAQWEKMINFLRLSREVGEDHLIDAARKPAEAVGVLKKKLGF